MLLKPVLESYTPYHNVYVIELDKKVMAVHKFKAANPKYIHNAPCVYVGMTGHTPDIRFKKHMDGIKNNVYVTNYGLRLMPEIYSAYNPSTFDDACANEIAIANELRAKGWGVWSA